LHQTRAGAGAAAAAVVVAARRRSQLRRALASARLQPLSKDDPAGMSPDEQGVRALDCYARGLAIRTASSRAGLRPNWA